MWRYLLNIATACIVGVVVGFVPDATCADAVIVALVWYAYSDLLDRIKKL